MYNQKCQNHAETTLLVCQKAGELCFTKKILNISSLCSGNEEKIGVILEQGACQTRVAGIHIEFWESIFLLILSLWVKAKKVYFIKGFLSCGHTVLSV